VGYGKIRMRFETTSGFNIAAFGPIIGGERLQGPGCSHSFFNRYGDIALLITTVVLRR
jgi:hypothetical protein